MRVAYLVHRYPKVSHTFVRREIAALEAGGVEVLRITIRPPSSDLVDDADRAEAERTLILLNRNVTSLFVNLFAIALFRFPAFCRAAFLAVRIGYSSERGLFRHAAYLVEACTLVRWLAAGRIQHLHAHFGTNPTTVATLCRELGGPPFSFTVHCYEELAPGYLRSFPEKLRRAAFVIGASDWVRDELTRVSPRGEWEKIYVVHCGVNEVFLNEPKTSFPDTRRLVCVARLCKEKGQSFLLEAAARVAASGRRFELLLVGDGSDRAMLEDEIRRLGLADRVRITGWKTENEVRELMVSSRALVLPSLAEGLPVVIMEAMALCRPVIATDVAAISELVENQVSGWLVPAASVDALALAMTEALDAPPEALARMGRSGAQRVARSHDVRREAGRLYELFRSSVGLATSYAEPSPSAKLGAGYMRRGDEPPRIGIVVIGRNEGQRLVRCLRSVVEASVPIVYVDSGSTDGSVERARELGVRVVELDGEGTFTAARARNAGFEELTRNHPAIETVQFVDGDCELRRGWLQAGLSFLDENPDVALVCGHLRERAPFASWYQRLADIEWSGPPGDVRVPTGTVMVRVRSFVSVGGFNGKMIGGEEPDLCLRLRSHGARTVRLDREMAVHEMAMFEANQWWRRCSRAGHSYAELFALHGRSPDRPWRRKLLSLFFWAVLLPLLILAAAWHRSIWGFVLPSAYAVLFARIVLSTRARGVDMGTAALYACSCIVGKFAELSGVLRFLWSRFVRRQTSPLIEYRKESSISR